MESKSNFTTLPPPPATTYCNLCPSDVAILGLQEVMSYCWLDVEGLRLVSLLSARARQSACNGRYWRLAIRAMFPIHPFEACDRTLQGMTIFSPATRADWKTFLSSAVPLRAPNWIIDITRPQNGCGGCTRHSMKSTTAQQATWRTS